jgi:DNA-binding response OmpR family regulator
MERQREDQYEDATVLVVEDDPTLRSTLAFNLTREGYKVLTARTGPAALDVVNARGDELSLILLDVMLPELSGLHVLREIRQRYDIPVLMVSAKGEEQDKVDGLELGADDYVVKPFSLRELLARVRATVRRRAVPAARPPRVLMRGEIRIEPDRRRVTVGGEELHLRPKEFGLLVTLAMEPGRVFGRQDLLDLVWGDDVVVDERAVDVHISWLRGKLQDAGVVHATIRTVYGAGYRFVVTRDDAGDEASVLPAPQHAPGHLARE